MAKWRSQAVSTNNKTIFAIIKKTPRHQSITVGIIAPLKKPVITLYTSLLTKITKEPRNMSWYLNKGVWNPLP
jgi:hypothetical protein